MTNLFPDFLLEKSIEIYAAAVATLGILLWAIERRDMKKALKDSNAHNLTNFRLKAQQSRDNAESRLRALETKFSQARETIEEHCKKESFTIGDPFARGIKKGGFFENPYHQSESGKHNANILNRARAIYIDLENSQPGPNCTNTAVLEKFISAANRSSGELDNLASQLKHR